MSGHFLIPNINNSSRVSSLIRISEHNAPYDARSSQLQN